MNNQNHLRSSSQPRSIKLGDKVRRLRLDLRLTQDDVTQACELSSNAILSKIENNELIPSIKVACDLAHVLNCTVGYLMGESELRNAPRFDALWREFYIDFTHLSESDMRLLSNIAKLMLKKDNDLR